VAIQSAPGVLAVKVDYERARGTIGTKEGTEVSSTEILAQLEKIGYHGEFINRE
jgi:hypothetical protein